MSGACSRLPNICELDSLTDVSVHGLNLIMVIVRPKLASLLHRYK